MGTSRTSMFVLAAMTLLFVTSFLAMLFRVDPAYADRGTLGVFYVSVFAAVSGVTAWSLMLVRAKARRTKRPLRYFFRDALRQSLLVGGIVTVSLLLQASRHLNFLWVLGVVAVAFTIEAYRVRMADKQI